jgi:DNA helicase MCM9
LPALRADAGQLAAAGPCPHCKRSSTYSEALDEKVVHDYQEIRVQEQVQKLGMGSIPRAITVVLQHDLVDTCKAGDDVVVTGVPIHRW